MNGQPVVLAFTRWYLPGYRAGGPIRSLANLADHLGHEFDIRIITQDRDMDDECPYSGIDPFGWNVCGKARVRYLSRQEISLVALRRLILEVSPAVIYLNSFFDSLFTQRTLILRRLGKLPDIPVVLAPRGEFSRGALELKRWKKFVFLRVAQHVGLYSGLIWQASSELEGEDIRRTLSFVPEEAVRVAMNLPSVAISRDNPIGSREPGAALRICFLSRISQKKNLEFALTCLLEARKNVVFTIYGPLEDRAYWARCQAVISALPSNVSVDFGGELEHRNVGVVLQQHDLFFLPTRGENFGHVILEALSAGLPALISDQTPWQDLEQNQVGWALPLADRKAFARVIDGVAAWPAEKLNAIRRKAIDYGRKRMIDTGAIEANRRLLLAAAGSART